MAVSTSGVCGQPNEVHPGDCIVCGRSFPTFKEEVTLGYLESTHILWETYRNRMARRHAFQAGMNAVSFILILRGVSQAPACDLIMKQQYSLREPCRFEDNGLNCQPDYIELLMPRTNYILNILCYYLDHFN